MIERKLNLETRYTDLFESVLGKKYKVKTDHKTMLIVQELFTKKNPTEADDEKAMELILGKENWEEIRNYLGLDKDICVNFRNSILLDILFHSLIRHFGKLCFYLVKHFVCEIDLQNIRLGEITIVVCIFL